jgi:transcription antitermination protein NusB
MGARNEGRRTALQILFARDVTSAPIEQAASRVLRQFEADAEGIAYAEEIASGVAASLVELDHLITTAAINWRLDRMSRVDRNILRMGAWELRSQLDTPRAVIIDEAVEIAKSFGAETSSSFVNGVLGKIADTLGRKSDDTKS